MKEDVGLQLAEEEEGQRLRIGAADGAALHGAPEVVGQQADDAARRHVFASWIEWHRERRGVHLHGDRGADDAGEERDEAPGEVGQGDARIFVRIEAGQLQDLRGHGGAEERLLGVEVLEDGRGGDVQRLGDVRQRGGREPARLEGGAGGFEDLVARDARGTSHG